MNRGAAMERLGLVPTAINELTREAIMLAYRDAVRAAHPDTNGASGMPLAELQKARDTLLQDIAKRDSACKLCAGTGRLPGRIGVRRCDACAGTGDRQC